MRVKDIRNVIKDLPDDMEVIIIGEYDYGISAKNIAVKDMIFDNTEYDEENPPKVKKVLALRVNEYLYGGEDLGEEKMWMTPDTYQDVFLEYNKKNKDEDEDVFSKCEEDEDEYEYRKNTIRIKQLPNKKYEVYW